MQDPDRSEGPRDKARLELSVVMAAGDSAQAGEVLRDCRPVLDGLGMSYEVVCVVDSEAEAVVAELSALGAEWRNLQVFERFPWTGEDGELALTYKRARGALVLTLPAWHEVVPEDIPALFEALGSNDMAIGARRRPAGGQLYRRLLAKSFRAFFGRGVSDVFCRTRLSRQEVLEEVSAFGLRQHFMPIIAYKRGYSVVETEVRNAAGPGGSSRFIFKPFGHLRAFFDALTLYVVLKFLHRPLRFFGSVGVPLFVIGVLVTAALGLSRILFGVPLSDRPLLILSTLTLVLGIQIVALGLVGEIIIFANSRQMKQYRVGRIVSSDPAFAGRDEEGAVDREA